MRSGNEVGNGNRKLLAKFKRRNISVLIIVKTGIFSLFALETMTSERRLSHFGNGLTKVVNVTDFWIKSHEGRFESTYEHRQLHFRGSTNMNFPRFFKTQSLLLAGICLGYFMLVPADTVNAQCVAQHYLKRHGYSAYQAAGLNPYTGRYVFSVYFTPLQNQIYNYPTPGCATCNTLGSTTPASKAGPRVTTVYDPKALKAGG